MQLRLLLSKKAGRAFCGQEQIYVETPYVCHT